MAIIYPIGDASFESIRSGGALYIDKTDLIYDLVKESKYYILSRPRRFGKSLLVSTLEAYFRGKKGLFDGLRMAVLEQDWIQYPVLRVDFSRRNFTDTETLVENLEKMLSGWERDYGITPTNLDSLSGRFEDVISTAHAQTGRQVVVLVDEYDKPLLDCIMDEPVQAQNQQVLSGFYGTLKGMQNHLRFVFLTGITRFAHLNIFSGLNNLKDISLAREYATLCGITEQELHNDLEEGVQRLAQEYNQTLKECYAALKAKYDGYCFSPRMTEGVYNPFSLLWALSDSEYGNYWYETGTPSFLFRLIEKQHIVLSMYGGYQMKATEMRGRNVERMGTMALLYQTGYLTIENYDEQQERYTLRFPNEEVRKAFFNDLLADFFQRYERQQKPFDTLAQRLMRGEVVSLMQGIHALIAGLSYQIAGNKEFYFQNVLLTIFTMLGGDSQAEVDTSNGRIDLVVKMPMFIYLFEFKLDHPVAEAMEQIEEKDYGAQFMLDARQLFKVGVRFSSKTRNMAECTIQTAGEADIELKLEQETESKEQS